MTTHDWPKGQTKHLSLIEAITGGALATLTSVVLQRIVYPAMGVHVATETTVKLAGFYCFWVIVRTYLIRRAFNRVDHPLPDPTLDDAPEEEPDEDPAPERTVFRGKITPADLDDIAAGQHARMPVIVPSRKSPGFDPSCPACDLLGRPCAGHRTGLLAPGEQAD